MALEALKDLFITNLLPDGRRLVPFETRPLLQVLAAVEASSPDGNKGVHSPEGKAAGRALLMWYFEDQVRWPTRFFVLSCMLLYNLVGLPHEGDKKTAEGQKGKVCVPRYSVRYIVCFVMITS